MNVRDSPGFSAGSPDSPTLEDSLILSGTSPPLRWSIAASVLRTTTSWSIVPVFFTMKATSPLLVDVGEAVNVIGPFVPLVSVTVTLTVLPLCAPVVTVVLTVLPLWAVVTVVLTVLPLWAVVTVVLTVLPLWAVVTVTPPELNEDFLDD